MQRRIVTPALLLIAAMMGQRPVGAEVSRTEADESTGQMLVSMVVTPAAPEPPVLKYALLPTLPDRRAGDAAVVYLKTSLLFNETAEAEFYPRYEKWESLALEHLPLGEVQTELNQRDSTFQMLDRAARQERCDWNFPFHDGSNLVMLLLPELQKMRSFGRLLTLRTRALVARGQYAEAAHSMQTYFQMAEHTAEGRLLIGGLVGVAIATTAVNGPVDDWIAKPGSPNLYWALAALPRPLFDFARSIETEQHWLYLSYPQFSQLRSHVYSISEMNSLIDAFAKDLSLMQERSGAHSRLAFVAMVAVAYPNCKRRLIEQGVNEDLVEAMPAAQVVLADALRTYDEIRDDCLCWANVPYWQAEPRIAAVERSIYDAKEVLPIARSVLPAIHHARTAFARMDRQIAQRMTIEAIRAYAAAHGGQLPKALIDITELPIPRDPMTDLPFEYQLSGEAATLKSPIRPGGSPVHGNSNFEIRISK